MTYEQAIFAIPKGRYRHYKGNEYEVIEIAHNSETLEPMVVYRALYGKGEVWVRPAVMWNERVGDTLRFTKIDQEVNTAEILDIVNENGEPTGETVDRETAHLKGIRHRTAHVWLLREKGGKIQVLLQKRAENKSSYPNCYDISSAGHIPAGVDYIPSALRELNEELGISATPDDLIFCGIRFISYDDNFFGKEFHDRQVSKIYAIWLDINENSFVLQKEEVDSVLWIDFDECIKAVESNSFKHCILMEELMILKKYIDSCRKEKELKP